MYRLHTWELKQRVHVTLVRNKNECCKRDEEQGKIGNYACTGTIITQQKITEFLHTRTNSLYKVNNKSYGPEETTRIDKSRTYQIHTGKSQQGIHVTLVRNKSERRKHNEE